MFYELTSNGHFTFETALIIIANALVWFQIQAALLGNPATDGLQVESGTLSATVTVSCVTNASVTTGIIIGMLRAARFSGCAIKESYAAQPEHSRAQRHIACAGARTAETSTSRAVTLKSRPTELFAS